MDVGVEDASPRSNAGRSRLRVDILLFLFAFVAVGPFVQTLSAQPAARLALTAAVWDRHTVDVSGYPLSRIDEAFHDGQLRSDKAPGQPLLAVPFYALYRLVGGDPAIHADIHGNLGLWWVSLWSSAVPFGLLLILMRRVVESIAPGYGTELALAVGFGTMLFPFAGLLFGHELAAALGFATWVVARGSSGRRDRLLYAGLLGGATVAVEYTAAPIILGVLAVMVWRYRTQALWFILGTVPAGIVLAVYQAVAFGSPLRLSYTQKTGHGTHVPGHAFSFSILARAFGGDRGLLIVSPLCVLGLGYAIWLVFRPGPLRADAFVACFAFGSLLTIIAKWPNPWGGASPGPRYLILAMPFIVIPLAARWKYIRPLGLGLAAVGALVGAVALSTSPYVSVDARSAPHLWFDWLLHGPHMETLYTMTVGGSGWFLHAAVIAVVGVALWRAQRALTVGAPDQATVSS